MKFRAKEEIADGRDRALHHVVQTLPPEHRAAGEAVLDGLIKEYGPVVQAYPSWHPLVSRGPSWKGSPATTPEQVHGYDSCDHTVYFRNAFVTCPRHTAAILKSVRKLRPHFSAAVQAKVIKGPLYTTGRKAVVVTCHWTGGLDPDGMIPLQTAAPLMMEQELPCREWARVAETWETMRGLILGRPCGSQSSLFVSEKTGQSLKELYLAMVRTGMFGPVKERAVSVAGR